jgi:hypothetical protein
LFPALLNDYVSDDNPVRSVDVFVDGLDLDKLGFVGIQPLDRGRPSYHPGMLLKVFIYGYLNRVPSSRRLERECQRNIERIWLTGQLTPDFKTIADFRRDNGKPTRLQHEARNDDRGRRRITGGDAGVRSGSAHQISAYRKLKGTSRVTRMSILPNLFLTAR